KVQMIAPAMEAVAEYLSGGQSSTYFGTPSRLEPAISRASIEEREHSLLLSVDFQSPFPLSPPELGFVIYDTVGNPVFGTSSRWEPPVLRMPSASSGCIEVVIPKAHFRPDRYLISLWFGDAYSDYCELAKVLRVQVSGTRPCISSQYIGS